MKYFITFFLILSIILLSNAQDYQPKIDPEQILKYTKSLSEIPPSLISQTGLNSSVEPDQYLVDAGDVFVVKIDIKGPTVKIFQATVTPDGYVLLPEISSIYVRFMTLNVAKNIIIKRFNKKFGDAVIEVFLFQIHPITVSVVGATENTGSQELLSTSRLYDAIQMVMEPSEIPRPDLMKVTGSVTSSSGGSSTNWELQKSAGFYLSAQDSNFIKPPKKIALRRVRLIRQNNRKDYDLLKFQLLGDESQNPYLMNGDIIVAPFGGMYQNTITVSGAVGNPNEFEFIKGDNLELVLELAGKLLAHSDSNHIELYRYDTNDNSLKKMALNYEDDRKMLLKPEDRIMVRHKTDYQKSLVAVLGEVRFPGEYPIIEGKTTLKDIISEAGGFSSNAYLKGSRILRHQYLTEDVELKRLQNLLPSYEMSEIERSYFRLRPREDLGIVSVDFHQIFQSDNNRNDILLKNNDLIYVPKSPMLVYVSGGIRVPGNLSFQEEWNYKQYIEAAGGFSKRAKKKDVKIIKYKTGKWLEAEDETTIEEGDIIFVPVKNERDWWAVVRETITVTAQVGAIVAVIVSLQRY